MHLIKKIKDRSTVLELPYIFTGLGLITLDQITKQVAQHFLFDNTIHFTDWFRFYLTYNKGIAFSIPIPRLLLILITVGFLVFFVTQLWATFVHFGQRWSGVLILSGAMGNLIDRVLFGAVIDFLSFWNFPVFNVADILISVGVLGFVLCEVFEKQKTSKTSSY